MINPSLSVESTGRNLFEALAHTFPVACASDEFYYFPQVLLPNPDWRVWDRFSADTVTNFVRQLSNWEKELDQVDLCHQLDLAIQIDSAFLKNMARTLREQLSEVRVWETQPTFYLTLACIGLAEAMESEDPAAKHKRAEGLADFLDQAGRNLKRIPVLFRDIGLEMVRDTRKYLLFLENTLPELKPALAALDRFNNMLVKVPTCRKFQFPRDLLEHILRFHLHADLDIPEIEYRLDREISEMRRFLNQEAGSLIPVQDTVTSESWQKALESIPMPVIGKKGLVGFYREEVERLCSHCLDKDLVSENLVSSCPVRVSPMPAFLAAIRTSSSYSIPPGHPPRGGIFYVFNTYQLHEGQKKYHREYKMLSAHETYPGHHLLDSVRWGLKRFCRRVIEQPIFYEGWACFAEVLMGITGYFSDPADRILLAKRRLWRAMRGKVDIGLQTGAMDISTAAGYLKETGISMKQAQHSANKYPLNPGYQLCYTLGLRRFLDLFDRYGGDNVPNFVRTVLSQGEIGFSDLEETLRSGA